MEGFSIKFIEHDGFLEAEATGVFLSVEDLMKSSFEIINKCIETQNSIVLMSRSQLVISVTKKEVEELMAQVQNDLKESFEIHCIALEGNVGAEEQKIFEDLSKSAGLKYELFKERTDALNRISELTLKLS